MSKAARLQRQRLGIRVRELRQSQGLSVPALAVRAALSTSSIYRIEAALAPNVRLVTLARVAAGLRLSSIHPLFAEETGCKTSAL